jgi:hypothetical protein
MEKINSIEAEASPTLDCGHLWERLQPRLVWPAKDEIEGQVLHAGIKKRRTRRRFFHSFAITR